jgi:hypothetical protein
MMRDLSTPGWRRPLLLGLPLLALAGAALLLPPIPQPPAYHRFADQSTCLGVPHCFDVASNLLFVAAGVAGLAFLRCRRGRAAFRDRRERLPYALFFLCVVLVGLASGYYHLAPDNARLLWDRLAVALALMSWFGAIVTERVDVALGRRLLPVLLLAGLGSAAYWGWSEALGRGDLRAYGVMQSIPFVLVPLLLRLYPPRYENGHNQLAVLALYLVALLCDFLDRPIAALTGSLSGHTLKHVVAAGAALLVIAGLAGRRALGSGR